MNFMYHVKNRVECIYYLDGVWGVNAFEMSWNVIQQSTF